MSSQLPDVMLETDKLKEHREDREVRDHDLYMEQSNWTVADLSCVDNLFVADMSGMDETYPFPNYNESVRIDLDGVSCSCDAFEAGHNICSSIGLNKETAKHLRDELDAVLSEQEADSDE